MPTKSLRIDLSQTKMASATARPSFTFNLLTSPLTQPSSSSSHPRFLKTLPTISKPLSISKSHFAPPKSIDVSKEDKPAEEASANGAIEAVAEQPEDGAPKRRPEEKFAVLNTGVHECRSCGFNYNESSGDPSYPIPPGLPFDKLPDDWRCPTCGASQNFFVSKRVEIAGFAENQQFGLGANTLTSGQKGLLIYGGLGLGFLFFLSGYFLQ